MEKRAIIAIILSILVILLWHRFTADMYSTSYETQTDETLAITKHQGTITSEESIKKKTHDTGNVKEQRKIFETDKFVITFSNVGGCIQSIYLKEYKDSVRNSFYNLSSAETLDSRILTITSQKISFDEDILSYDFATKNEERVIEYTALSSRIKVTKRYILDKTADFISFEAEFENKDSQTHAFGYDIIAGSRIEAEEPLAARYIQVDASVNNTIYRDRNVRNGMLFHQGDVQWVALQNKYFAIILKPFGISNASFIKKCENKMLCSGIRMANRSLSPGSRAVDKFMLYIGPKKADRLSSMGMGFEKVIHYGIFSGISEILLSLLNFFHTVVHNWGVSIIMLAAVTSLILSPLTKRSFKSMQKMQALQPEIQQLQEKYKKNPQKLNKEIMELYKKYKVNPLGGCFPMLLQLPIFIALYQGLMRFVDLKNASFLWIKDLSLPDSVKLAFLGGKGIHILPILMAGVMFLQQKFSHPQHQIALTEQQKQQQRMMGIMMPLLFGFIFYNFPSGLVLYWLTNTLLMTLSQIAMMKKAT